MFKQAIFLEAARKDLAAGRLRDAERAFRCVLNMPAIETALRIAALQGLIDALESGKRWMEAENLYSQLAWLKMQRAICGLVEEEQNLSADGTTRGARGAISWWQGRR